MSVITLILILYFSTPLKDHIQISTLVSFLIEIKGNPYAPIIYVIIYMVAVAFALPGIPLTLISGPLFGLWWGTLLVLIGANLGAQITFLISRYLGKDVVEKLIRTDGFVYKISNKVKENGLMVMLYIRILPIFPYNVINYLMGMTPIKYRDYTLGSILGMIPGTFIFVYLSTTATNIKDNPLGIVIPIILFLLLAIGSKLVNKKQNILNPKEFN
ncbi:TVP38/TMEM64 family protein [Clostridium sp. D2Q-11]|uniref:TVP38/TMEM64 family membrane protein n=1 Tax=Anaeromonas frigoriresistens TaxID=2683708 RepID=A0A942UUK4_9FIRM|nr:TVP38/TMEM64 family protein [Anaeromonas frigoriresistens]MBS4539519.1 TVP38/TMEM64 family protein [Anaeromonas frigoriresistens]